MSSGTRYEPYAARHLIGALAGEIFGKDEMMALINGGMTPRQRQLNRFWGYYNCEQYAARSTDWNGHPLYDELDTEAISSRGYIPPGHYAAQNTPLKFRKPSAPYHLAKVIVDRFTGLLFSQQKHPKIRMEDDAETEDYVRALAEKSRLWPQMMLARTYGGAMGSVALSFCLVDGDPIIEVHDPRWLFPEFVDRHTLKLTKLEKRYAYPVQIYDEDAKRWETQWIWYRRLIDAEKDVVFRPTPVIQGQEPEWIADQIVEHGLGFVPAVWVQNLPSQDDIDGYTDCHGVYDMLETIDALLAQAIRGAIFNSDPTAVISTDMPMDDIRKGSDNAIKTEKGGDFRYAEISGAGPQTARDLVKELRGYVLEVAQCVLDHPDIVAKTATEIERMYSSMLAKAEMFREQYGEFAIRPLLEMMIKAVRKLDQPVVDEEGNIIRQSVNLPPRVEKSTDGEIADIVPRKLGKGGTLQLQWPRYFDPTLTDVQAATLAVVTAKSGSIIDDEHATQFIAPYYNIEDPVALIDRLRKQREEQQTQLDTMSLGNNFPAIPA